MDPNAKQQISQPQTNQIPGQPVPQAQNLVPPGTNPPPAKNKNKSILLLEVGLFEVGFIILMLLIFFGVLNYFNILSLSSLYPPVFGILPHQKVSNSNSALYTPSKTPDKISGDYSVYAKNLDKPAYIADLNQYIVNSIFIGFNKNKLETQSATGRMTFSVDSNTILSNLVANPNSDNASGGGTLENSQTYTIDSFPNEVPAGSLLQIFYSPVNNELKAIKIFYIQGHKFN